MERPLSKGFQGFFERVSTILIDPREAFELFTDNGPRFLEPLFLTLLTVASLGSVVGSFITKIFLLISALSEGFGGFAGPRLPQIAVIAFAMPPLIVLIFIGITVILWIVATVLAHLFSVYVFQGKGKLSNLIKLYGYSATPYFLTVFGLLMIAYNIRLAVYFIPLFLASAFWSVMINIAAIQVTYKLSSGRAFISAFIVPTIIVLIGLSIWGFMI